MDSKVLNVSSFIHNYRSIQVHKQRRSLVINKEAYSYVLEKLAHVLKAIALVLQKFHNQQLTAHALIKVADNVAHVLIKVADNVAHVLIKVAHIR